MKSAFLLVFTFLFINISFAGNGDGNGGGGVRGRRLSFEIDGVQYQLDHRPSLSEVQLSPQVFDITKIRQINIIGGRPIELVDFQQKNVFEILESYQVNNNDIETIEMIDGTVINWDLLYDDSFGDIQFLIPNHQVSDIILDLP